MSSIALNTGQSHFHYGPDLPFEDDFIVEMLIRAAGDHKSSQAFSLSAGTHSITAVLNIDYWTDYLVDYKVNVTSEDAAGNTVYFEKKINGVFGGVLDALADIWDAVVGAFEAAAKAVGDAVNFLGELLKEMVLALITPLGELLYTRLAVIAQNMALDMQGNLRIDENGIISPSGYNPCPPVAPGGDIEPPSEVASIITLIAYAILAAILLLYMFGPLGNVIATMIIIAIAVALVVYFVNNIEDILDSNELPYQNDAEQASQETTIAAGFIGWFFAFYGLASGYLQLEAAPKADPIGMQAIQVGVAALIFGLISLFTPISSTPVDDIVIGYITLVLGLTAFAFGLKSMASTPYPAPGFSSGIISMILGGISIFITAALFLQSVGVL